MEDMAKDEEVSVSKLIDYFCLCNEPTKLLKHVVYNLSYSNKKMN